MKISLVTLVKNRRKALVNLLQGISNGIRHPDEVIVVHMNEQFESLATYPFKVIQVEINSEHTLPLAEARNLAMQMAKNEHVIFLDVDCIPAINLVSVYAEAFVKEKKLFSGRVRYLSEDAMNTNDLFNNLERCSQPDPVRNEIDQYSYELFWSLNFGCTKSTFELIGGFDPAFIGYGAEDTDFSFSARKNAVPLITLQANAFHQYHASYDPPLNHFHDILANANIFYHKWGTWPMTGWIRKFEEMGLIRFNQNQISVLRMPNQVEIQAALKP